VIDRHGEIDDVGDVHNSWRFIIATWQHLLNKLGLKTNPNPHDLHDLGNLWRRVGKLERNDGLMLAATFDRCWFPRTMIGELITAMHAATYSSGPEVARILEGIRWRRGDRGVTFQGSLASPWACAKTDGWHVIDPAGHACRECGKKIQHAGHMLAEIECCREAENAVYRSDS
jgi:hypothetical protein